MVVATHVYLDQRTRLLIIIVKEPSRAIKELVGNIEKRRGEGRKAYADT